MKTLNEEEMAKLPKWARHHIEMLYANIDDLDRQRVRLFGKSGRNPPPQVLLSSFHGISIGDENDQPLPDSQALRIYPQVRQERRWANYIDFRLDAERERVYVHGGVAGLIIEPSSANTCYLGLQERF